MRVLRGTLTFVLGMVIGIILFVLAIGGTVAIIGTSITVGKLQSSITNTEVIASDSELYNKTILDAVKGVISDVQNFDKLSLKVLYEHYGIKLLNGISGIDFTDKEFYSVPIPDLVNDLSIIVNSFTLEDVSKIAGVDFASYGLPVLTNNLDKNLSTAIDNILGSINGELSIRAIKDSFGIDIGVDDNKILALLQDVVLSEFGNVINVLRVNSLLNADTDTFIPSAGLKYYAKTDKFEEISSADLKKTNTYKTGVETSLLGGIDSDGDGTADKMNIVETRYVKTTVTVDGEQQEQYVVDNSTYKDGFDFEANTKVFYRHVLFETTDKISGDDVYMIGYANRIDAINGKNYTLIEKGFVKVDDFTFDDDLWAVLDDEPNADSKLSVLESGQTAGKTYKRVHKGTSETLLQRIAFMTVAELQNADNLLKSITVGDVISINENTAKVVIALKNSTLGSIGEDIKHLTIDQIVDTDAPNASPIMKALANHGCTIDDLATITNELTLGELMNLDFDEYAERLDGEFTFVPFYVKYNKYIHGESEQRYALIDGDYMEHENGEFVQTGYYTLYSAGIGNGKRYTLVHEGDSIILQSLARRGCTLNDLGKLMDNLYLSELLRIDGNSAHLFKSLAKRGCTLGEFDTIIDDLEIGEIIEITDDTAKIMKSLAARHCTISELGAVADELSLGEMIDIKMYEYTEDANGKYVRIEDADTFTLFDASNPAYATAVRFAKNSEGEFVEDANGAFVHAVYYTLYNPAEHGDSATRFNRTKSDGASSALLQRFAGATLGSFSTAFDGLMLSDVMSMDADIYAQVDMAYIENSVVDDKTSERFFKYDSKLGVYRVVNLEEIRKNPDVKYYHIAQSGDSTAILKKLAYVKVDEMSDAMEAIIDDMMLSEFISVHTESAVKLGTFDGTFDEDTRYFMEFGAGGNASVDGDTKYVYVYDLYGTYAKANFRPIPLEGNIETSHVYYEYLRYSEIPTSDFLEKSTELTSKGNLYYYNYDTKAYERNMVLCTYMLTHPSGKYLNQLYYRQIKDGATAADVDNVKVFDGVVYKYTGTKPQYGIFVRDNFRGYIEHIENDPAFADKPLCTFEKSANGLEYYVDKDDVQKLATVIGSEFESTGIYNKKEDGIFYARRECEYVFILSPNGDWVYVDGQYVQYQPSVHTDATLPRFEKKMGYVATINEVSITEKGTQNRTSEFEFKPITEFIRGKSSPVLRMLARGTISELTEIINNATIDDIIEAEPGSLFDNKAIKEAKISELGNVLGDLLTNMTIGDLLDWSHVTKVNEYVRIALEDITIQTLFRSLKFNEVTNEITVDMFSIYGYDADYAAKQIADENNPQ